MGKEDTHSGPLTQENTQTLECTHALFEVSCLKHTIRPTVLKVNIFHTRLNAVSLQCFAENVTLICSAPCTHTRTVCSSAQLSHHVITHTCKQHLEHFAPFHPHAFHPVHNPPLFTPPVCVREREQEERENTLCTLHLSTAYSYSYSHSQRLSLTL